MNERHPPQRDDGAPWRNFHGRRKGKRLRPGQQAHLESTLERLRPKGVGWDENPDRRPIDLGALFGFAGPLWLEIGFGAGEHMIAQAEAHPEARILGCEPFINGVAQCVAELDRRELTNIRIHPGDARDLMDVLPEGSVDRAFLLYPDPWPKARHHKRRFVNPWGLDALARVMRPGAELRVATDIADYVRHSLLQVRAHPDFDWTAEGPADWREPWAGWPSTRYERKALREGRRPHYLTFRRR